MQHLLEVQDEPLLLQVLELLAKESDPIVAHTTSGEPLRLSEYRKKLDQGLESASRGKGYTTEQVKEELTRWKTQ